MTVTDRARKVKPFEGEFSRAIRDPHPCACAPSRGLLTEKQAAEFLGLSAGTLRVSRCTGPIPGRIFVPFIRMGRAIRYDEALLREWLTARVVTGEAAHG